MATDFNTKTIATSGSFKPTFSNTPLDIRTRIYSLDDIENIPLPYVGMIFTLVDTENNTLTNYQVKSLKSKFINTTELPNALIDEYETFNESSQVDLSSYALKSEIPDISGKVDKVSGKGLSTNDYTTTEKNKLAGLKNYDDTEVQSKISQLETSVENFPTKLSQFENDLPTSTGGTGATKISALITDFGAVNNSSVTYNTSTKTYSGTDCSQAILDAIASGYTKIEFPAGGNFIVNTIIPVNKKVLIEGNGANIYVNPISGSDHNVFYFKDGSDYSVIRGLNFYSTNAYTVNLATNVTALSSNNCAIGINNNAENIVVSDCYAEGFKYFAACSVCKNIKFDNCRGKDNYFSIYTGFNAYNTVINNCHFAEQTETDIYGHVLYLGGATYGVEINNCYFEALGDNSSNIIKCGADQDEYCTGVVVKNTTLKCRTKASFLYCHAHADVQYENCHMIFTDSTSDAYARLLQFNAYSNMYFKGCKFELDSVQRFTHAFSFTDNSLIFEDCSFIIKNTVNKHLTFNLNAGAKNFKLIRCTMDYSNVDRAINLLSSDLYSLEMLNCTLYVPAGSILGQASTSSISYTQTTSPRLLMTNTNIIRTYSSTDSSILINYVKGSATPIISLANITIVNGQANTGTNSGKFEISTANEEFTAYYNVINLSDSGVTGSTGGSGGGSTETEEYIDVPVNSTYANLVTVGSNNKSTVTNWTVSAAASYPATQAALGLTIDTSADTTSDFILTGTDTENITVTNATTLSANNSGEGELVAVQGTSDGGFYLAFRLSHTRLGISDDETDTSVMLTKFKEYLTNCGWILKFKKKHIVIKYLVNEDNIAYADETNSYVVCLED